MEFDYHWRHFEHGKNPLTGRPDYDVSACETDFFQGWSLREHRPYTPEGLIRQLQFDHLSRCRVFVVPNLRHTSTKEIDGIFDGWKKTLKADLVSKEEILGTEKQWKALLVVERNRAEYGDDFNLIAGLDEAGEEIYGERYDVHSQGTHVERYFRAMDGTDSSPGWIQKVFPQLPPEIFPTSQPTIS